MEKLGSQTGAGEKLIGLSCSDVQKQVDTLNQVRKSVITF